jgi:hypothetical protein
MFGWLWQKVHTHSVHTHIHTHTGENNSTGLPIDTSVGEVTMLRHRCLDAEQRLEAEEQRCVEAVRQLDLAKQRTLEAQKYADEARRWVHRKAKKGRRTSAMHALHRLRQGGPKA